MMNDGIYMELFAVKNGVRYNAKIIDMKEVSTTLTNSLMDGIEKLWTDNAPKAETKNQCNHNWKYESTLYNSMDMCYKKRYVCTWLCLYLVWRSKNRRRAYDYNDLKLKF